MKLVMHIYSVIKIAMLARLNDETLAILVRRWIAGGKRRNPIPDILLKSEVVALEFSLFLSVIGLVLTFVWIYHQHHTMVVRVWDGWNIGTVLALGFILMVVLSAIFRTKRKIYDNRNADEFCRGIVLINQLREEEGFVDDVWERGEFLDVASFVVPKYIYSRAACLQKLEGTPWREKEREEFDRQLTREIETLTSLALLPSSRDAYSKNRPPVVEMEAEFASLKKCNQVA